MTNREVYRIHLQNQSLKGTNVDFLISDRIKFCNRMFQPIVHDLLTKKDEMQKEHLVFEDKKIKLNKDGQPVFLLGKNKEDFEAEVNKLMDQQIKTSLINHLRLWLFPYFRLPYLSPKLERLGSVNS